MRCLNQDKKNYVFLPKYITGNYIKVSEQFIEKLYSFEFEKKAKLISSVYLYVKIKLNESHTNNIKISIREIAKALNISIGRSHEALKSLKSIDCDILIQTQNKKTTAQYIPEKDPDIYYVKFEKNTLKSLFKLGLNPTAVYTVLYISIHRINTITKNDYNTIDFKIKDLAKYMYSNERTISDILKLLQQNNFVNRLSQRGKNKGNILSLTKTYINKEHINTKQKSENDEHITVKNGIYRTNFIIKSESSEQIKDRNKDLKTFEHNTKKPESKKLSTKKPIESPNLNSIQKEKQISTDNYKNKEKVFLNKKDKGSVNTDNTNNAKNSNQKHNTNTDKLYNQSDTTETKITKTNRLIDKLENRQTQLMKKMNRRINTDIYKQAKSKYYDDKINVYRMYYRKKSKSKTELYIQYGAYLFDIDDYISYCRAHFNPDSPTYIYSPEKWKKAFIRDFNNRTNLKMMNNMELRIKNYVKEIEIETQESIPAKIKELTASIDRLRAKLNEEANSLGDKPNKDGNDNDELLKMSDEDLYYYRKLKDFSLKYPDEFGRISKELDRSIKNYGFTLNKTQITQMLVNRIDIFLKSKTEEEAVNKSEETKEEIKNEIVFA